MKKSLNFLPNCFVNEENSQNFAQVRFLSFPILRGGGYFTEKHTPESRFKDIIKRSSHF